MVPTTTETLELQRLEVSTGEVSNDPPSYSEIAIGDEATLARATPTVAPGTAPAEERGQQLGFCRELAAVLKKALPKDKGWWFSVLLLTSALIGAAGYLNGQNTANLVRLKRMETEREALLSTLLNDVIVAPRLAAGTHRALCFNRGSGDSLVQVRCGTRQASFATCFSLALTRAQVLSMVKTGTAPATMGMCTDMEDLRESGAFHPESTGRKAHQSDHVAERDDLPETRMNDDPTDRTRTPPPFVSNAEAEGKKSPN